MVAVWLGALSGCEPEVLIKHGLEMVRCVATARIVMPKSMVRLSAGRLELSTAEQAMCFMSGANSIFAGDKLLTTPNVEVDEDSLMFDLLGLKIKPAFDGTNPEFEMPKWASPHDFPRTFSVLSSESCTATPYPLDFPLADFRRLRFPQYAADPHSLLSPRPDPVPKLIR